MNLTNTVTHLLVGYKSFTCNVLQNSRLRHTVQLARCMCSSFDINEIVKQNKGKGITKKVQSKVKSKSTTGKTPKIDVNAPECFTVILDASISGKSSTDKDKQAEFKDCIEELEVKYIPSVSHIISKTMSKFQQDVLQRWKDSKIEELGGKEQFAAYQKETLGTGLNLHKCIATHLANEATITIEPSVASYWESVQSALGDVSDVKLLEVDTVHPEMLYAGKFDCIAKVRDTLCLIEWKTSSKPKPLLSSTYDNPLQVVAYIGAVNKSGILNKFEIPYITNGALVIAYASGEPATVHMMSPAVCEKYWALWKERVYAYWATRYQQSQQQ